MRPTTQNPNDPLEIRSPTAAYDKRNQEELKNALTDRLYDKGVSNRKLPGIERPNAEHLRPFTAKLTSRLEQREFRSGTSLQTKLQPVVPYMQDFKSAGTYFGGVPATAEGDERILYVGGIPRPNTIQDQHGTKKQRKPGTARVVKSITGVIVSLFPNG